MPFKSCIDLIVKIKGVEGAVINPYTHNILMNINRENDASGVPEPIQLSEPEFHALVRKQMEAALLPGKIFTKGEEFIKDLCSR